MTLKSSDIKIGNRTYSLISIERDTFDQLLASKRVYDEDVKSFVDYDEQIIVVREELTVEHKRELLLHEIIHACIADSGVDNEHVEQFVSLLSPRLACIIDKLNNLIDDCIM